MKKKNDNHYVYFKGARLSTKDANKAGRAIIFGMIGLFLAIFISEDQVIRFVIVAVAAGTGFFVVGRKKDNDKEHQEEK